MDQRVRMIITLMRNRINQDLTLNDLAASVYLSRWRLAHLFKQELGVPPAHYFKSLKMSEAKRLLETSPMSVKQIILRLGIKDKSHFERDFKKAYGLTPNQHRLATLQNPELKHSLTNPSSSLHTR